MKLGFLGAGNMAGAIIRGMLAGKVLPAGDIGAYDVDAEKLRPLEQAGIRAFAGAEELIAACDAILLAVKPQSFPDLAAGLKAAMTPDKLVISIMAGITAKATEAAVGCAPRLLLVLPSASNCHAESSAISSKYAFCSEYISSPLT
jgi:pyrroline-5-carboxylate reductase